MLRRSFRPTSRRPLALTLALIAATLALAALGGRATPAGAISSTGVTLYRDIYDAGPAITLYAADNGAWRNDQLAAYGWGGQASSLYVPPGLSVALYSETGYSGRCQRFGPGNYPDLRGSWIGNDGTYSVEVSGYCPITLCQDVNYLGTCHSFGYSDEDLGRDGFNDTVSSVALDIPGWRVALFSDALGRGRCSDYAQSVPSLVGSWVGNDTLSSFVMYQTNVLPPYLGGQCSVA